MGTRGDFLEMKEMDEYIAQEKFEGASSKIAQLFAKSIVSIWIHVVEIGIHLREDCLPLSYLSFDVILYYSLSFQRYFYFSFVLCSSSKHECCRKREDCQVDVWMICLCNRLRDPIYHSIRRHVFRYLVLSSRVPCRSEHFWMRIFFIILYGLL